MKLSSPPLDPLSKPQPRPPKSPSHETRIRICNRRREYLTRHPEYFKPTEHELAGRQLPQPNPPYPPPPEPPPQ